MTTLFHRGGDEDGHLRATSYGRDLNALRTASNGAVKRE